MTRLSRAWARITVIHARYRWVVGAGAVLGVLCVLTASAAAASLPDGRGYERVSQQDTNGIFALQSELAATELIVDDDNVLFGGGVMPYGDNPSGAQRLYLAQRTPDGWVDSVFGPPESEPDATNQTLLGVTPTLSGAVFENVSTVTLGPVPANQPPIALVYRGAGGEFTPIVTDASQSDTTDPSSYDPSQFGGISADGQTVVYSSDVTPPGLPSAGGLREVYSWQPDGAVTRLPDGAGEAPDCGNEVGGLSDYTVLTGNLATPQETTNAVSADGSTVFMESGQGPSDCSASQVYVSRGGATRLISTPTQPGVPAPDPTTESSASFEGATPDGDSAYFASANQLTSDAPGAGVVELYHWQAAQGATPATVSCVSCNVQGSVSNALVSPSGQYAYFLQDVPDSSGALVTELYVAHDGTTTFVGDPGPSPFNTSVAVNPAGDVFVYTGLDGELERASVSASGVSATCLSCLADGTPEPAELSNGANLGVSAHFASADDPGGNGAEFISADGDTVVFDSTSALTATATDGVDNVYRWTVGGGVALIAPAAGLEEVSPDATNIVFQSTDQLTADTTQLNTGTLYDARIGGGFPVPAAPGPGCTGSACQGLTPAPPSPPPVGSSGHTAGGVDARSLSLRGLRAPDAAALRRLRRSGRLTLVVPVSGAGTVRATLTAQIGGRAVTFASVAARVPLGRGHVTLRLRVHGHLRRRLGHLQHLTLTVTTATGEARSRRLTFDRPEDRS